MEAGHKRVRAYLGGELVADTIHPLLVWEIPYFPAYYLPEADVRTDLLARREEIMRTLDEVHDVTARCRDRLSELGEVP